ncbi:unnamed protein product [Echinostoma caproni]|uniref:DDE-1 domain-containing protein n=1 Tax=Echinostoma caproni TaxID=27848 RepID=A0A183B3W6_9TREM|nr:unnamed protein product [Echinostoma caproni]
MLSIKSWEDCEVLLKPNGIRKNSERPSGMITAVFEMACDIGVVCRTLYEPLVNSYRPQLIDTSLNIKFTGLKACTDVHQISGILPDSLDSFHSLMERFPNSTKPIEEINLVTDGVAHHLATKGPLVMARPRRLAPNKLAFAKCEFDI